MNAFSTTAKPSKLAAVFLGGGAMAAISLIPILNFINCACCAGIMGAAVLGVWHYKKSFPEDMDFGVGDGATIGALSGIVGAVLSSVGQMITLGLFSAEATLKMQDEFEAAFSQAELQTTDPAAIESVRELLMQLAANPFAVFFIILFVSLLIYVGFGALGGVIGGNIFKTKIIHPAQMPPMQNTDGF
ncbi:MAG: hypothetical protein WBQ23_15510 [Bacteroidota bacterium]